MVQTLRDDTAKRTRRKVERAVGSIKPTTPTRKVLVVVAVPIAGELTEQTVRLLEQKGPELAAKRVKLAKEKLPVAAKRARTKVDQLRATVQERRSKGSKGTA
jgi:hypothetical protein